MIKKLSYTFLGMVIMVAGTVYAAPYFTYQTTLLPQFNGSNDLGTTTAKWRNLFLNLSDGCLQISSGLVISTGSACGAGGGGGGGTFSTSTISGYPGVLTNYPNNNTDVITIGATGTSTAKFFFDPNQNSARIGSSNTSSTTIMGIFNIPTVGQGFLYTGSAGKVGTVSTSTIFGFTPANQATTITVNGTSNQITSSAGAQDLSANRTWTLSFPNQVIFPQYASTTNGFSTPYASSTLYFGANLTSCNGGTNALTWSGGVFGCNTIAASGSPGGTNGQLQYNASGSFGGTSTTTLVAGSNISFGGATPVILGSSPITISATAGSGTTVATSTVDWIVYNDGGTTKVYDTIAGNVPTSGTFSAVMNWIVNKSTSTNPARVNTQVRSGTYTCDNSIIINGGNSRFGPNLIFTGNASSTTIIVATPKCFDFRNQATVNISHVALAFRAGSDVGFYASSTAGSSVQSSLRESIFEDITFFSTTTGHTGYGFDLVGDFRNNYTHIMGDQVGNLWRSSNGYTNAQFINGDSHFMGFNFCELNNSGAGVCWDVNGNRGVVNQLVFDDINGISNDTGVNSNDILFRCTGSFGCSRVVVKGLNAEQFATTTQILVGNGVYIESSKYITPTTGGSPANKAVFETSSSAFNVGIQCKEIEVAAATTIFYDKNTLKTQPNSLQGINGANCIISDNGGSMRFATSTASIVRDVYDNVAGATWLSAIKVMGDKIVTNFSEAATDWISSIGSKMSFVVGGSERLSIADSGFGTTTVTGFTVNGSATSTSNVGFNISTGCYAINNVCISGGGGGVTSVTGTWPIVSSGGTTPNITFSGLSTTTNSGMSQGNLYVGSGGIFQTSATSSIANGTGITVTNGSTAYVLGSQPTINCNTANASTFGCLSAAKFSQFDSATTTAGTGLTYSGNAFNVNTSQNIATLSNLTSNGAILTSGGVGTLGIYTGTSCTNQFVRSLSGSIVATCATVANTDLANSSITINGSSVSLGGSITVASTTLLADTNSWTGVNRFGLASSTYHSFTTASTTNLIAGFITLSTTTAGTLKVSSNGVVWSDTSGGGAGYSTIQDEGSGLTARSILNFTGSGVNCVDNSGSSRTDCTINAGAATAGGSDKQLQFNDATALGGASGLEWDKNAGELSLSSGRTLILGSTATSSPSQLEVIKDGILGWFASTTGATIRPILNIFRNTTTGISGIGINSSSTEDALTVNGFANFDPQLSGCDLVGLGGNITTDQLAGQFCDWLALDSITDGGVLQTNLGTGSETNMPMYTVLRTGDTTSWASNEGVWLKTQRAISASTTLIAEILLRTPNVNVATTTGTYVWGLGDAGQGTLTTTAAYANPSNTCSFQASSTANWMAVVKRNGTFNEFSSTGIATSTTLSTFRRFRITQDYVNGCTFYVDGVQVASETAANSPVAPMQVLWGLGNNTAGVGTVGTTQNHYFYYAEPKIGWGRWQMK